MREWAAEHPVLNAVLVGVAGGILWSGVSLIVGGTIGMAAANGVFYGLALGAMTYFAQKRFRKTDARLDEQGKSLVFLRYPNARPRSLSTIWQMGIAGAGPGRIDFQPSVYEDLVPTGRSKALTGLSAMSSPRIVDRDDIKQGVPAGFHMVTLESDQGVLDVAAVPATLQKIQDAVLSEP
ncbi:hypothetical protein LFT45_17745 [Arthrobacter sp. FW305-BF8]|uniref:hypothetical protein n=1 Tax=Arthrobacter sp. FW305-BF8 TaxID=2879617 RepID=UPI001F322D63|nr:hypothetical protein [Arthrobacter sp. FW305-BF8]UKA53540.1 hypothetical protein LFT45_17745 [Arthrobacter sp. FW305-BF8]